MDKVSLLSFIIVLGALVAIILLPVSWFYKPLLVFAFLTFLVFVFSRLIVPHIGFVKSKLPKEIDPLLQAEIDKLTGSRDEKIRKSYDLVLSRFYGQSGRTFTNLSKLFFKGDYARWQEGGYANCHLMNYYLRLFLVRSGAVADKDIILRCKAYRWNLHQFMILKIDGKRMVLDLGFAYANIGFARKNDMWFGKRIKEERYDGLFLKK